MSDYTSIRTRKWTEAETALLRKLWPTHTANECVTLLAALMPVAPLTVDQVIRKASNLRIKHKAQVSRRIKSETLLRIGLPSIGGQAHKASIEASIEAKKRGRPGDVWLTTPTQDKNTIEHRVIARGCTVTTHRLGGEW